MKKISVLIMFLAFLCLQLAQAQTRQITGTVTSADDGLTIPGVQIVVLGSTIGITTDIDGNYTLTAPESATKLQFTFVGMETLEIDIAGRSVINVEMSEDLTALGEVIVLGYSTKGKNQITGSTVQISADELRDIPVTSIDQALQGKVAGMIINTSSGTPGSTQEIRIRGVSSFAASNSPLIVIDGVPVIQGNISGSSAISSLSSLAALNSQDIASVTVLKDASATSAYGARGSNGVIVITTLKGKAGKTKFNVSANYGFQNKAVNGREVLTAAEGEMLYLEAVVNTYGGTAVPAGPQTPDEAYAYADANSLFNFYRYESWRDAGRPEGDWGNAVLNENAPVYNMNVSASGGDDVSSFYVSLGYNKTEAVVIGNIFERITSQLTYSRNFSDRVKFTTSNNFSYTNQDKPFLETSAYFGNPHISKFFMPPTIPPRNDDGTPSTDYASSLFNILYLQDHNVTWNHMLRGISNTSLEIEIIDNLKFKTVAAFDYVMGHFKSFYNADHGDSTSENGTSEMSVDQDFNAVFQNMLDYRLTFLDNHIVDFKALMEFQSYNRWYLYGSGENFVTGGLTNINSAGANYDADGLFNDRYNLSYLGMANYSYMGKYIVDLTFRREGSSKFAADQRFGNFWAVGAAWNMSQENFLAGVSLINNLRLRGSYGVSGNSGIGDNSYQALLGFATNYGGLGASYPSSFGNPILTWEKNKNYDVGFDFAFLSNRIDGSLSYYNKETYDLLQDVPLTRTSGHGSIRSNIGSMVSKGFEGMLNFDIVRASDFNLSMSVNFATLNNEVTELAKNPDGEYIPIATSSWKRIDVGHTFQEWYMQEWAGVNPDTGVPMWYVDRGVDDTTTEIYNEAERVWIGKSAIPTISGGTGLHLDFMGVYIDANMYFAGGHMIEEQWDHYTWDNGLYSVGYFNGVADLLTRWQQPGDITDVPQFQFAFRPHNAVSTSTRQLYKGDYMRLKDAVLGYNLPSSLVSKAKLEGVSVYVRGTNLWTYALDERTRAGFDPETRADGHTGLETPPIKSIVFGININF